MEAGKHDFDGSYDPAKHGVGWASQNTFSVGVFEWEQKSSRNGLKRGKVKVRVVGLVSEAGRVYAKAREVVDKLDAGTYTGGKTVNTIAS
jgi:hypothetical protein